MGRKEDGSAAEYMKQLHHDQMDILFYSKYNYRGMTSYPRRLIGVGINVSCRLGGREPPYSNFTRHSNHTGHSTSQIFSINMIITKCGELVADQVGLTYHIMEPSLEPLETLGDAGTIPGVRHHFRLSYKMGVMTN